MEFNPEQLWLITAPIARSIGGWLQHALEDKKISLPEWRLLSSTVIRVGLITIGAYLGYEILDAEAATLSAIVTGFIFDKILDAVKSTKGAR